MSKILTRSFRDSCIFCLTVRTCRARVITKVAKILWTVTYGLVVDANVFIVPNSILPLFFSLKFETEFGPPLKKFSIEL